MILNLGWCRRAGIGNIKWNAWASQRRFRRFSFRSVGEIWWHSSIGNNSQHEGNSRGDQIRSDSTQISVVCTCFHNLLLPWSTLSRWKGERKKINYSAKREQKGREKQSSYREYFSDLSSSWGLEACNWDSGECRHWNIGMFNAAFHWIQSQLLHLHKGPGWTNLR